MSDSYDWYREERERAEGLRQKLDRVAFLVGYYGGRTGNSDLAELVDELKRLVYGPAPEDTTAEPRSASEVGS